MQLPAQYTQHPLGRPKIERRSDAPDAPPVVVGYAAVFYRADDPGTEYRLHEDTFERIMPGAFDAAIKEGDVVRALTNHDDNWLLGRSDLRTLRLSVDRVGLRYEIDPPDTGAGRDTVALLRRGDLDASSFSFRVFGGKRGKTVWVDEVRDGREVTIRELHEVELLDVGPVTYPAYLSASAGVRSDGYAAEVRSELQRWRAAQRTAELANVSIPDDWQLHMACAEAELLGLL